MKPSSAKNKGRRAQQFLRDRIRECLRFNFRLDDPDHVKSTPMGVSGQDIQLSPTAKKYFPWAAECKNSERIGFWPTVKQAEYNAGKLSPLILFMKNRTKPWVAIPSADFFALLEIAAWHLQDCSYDSIQQLMDDAKEQLQERQT